ncbi:MAG: helix-turn-helix transcriptional regulator [Christensenella sp.]|nr:helix-turn-helix transcriptional regulator [Christensenella sp.]
MYQRIKKIRNVLHLNQMEFSKRLGMSQSSLAMIEVGKRKFSEKHIKVICSEFHVNEKWLRAGEGEMFLTSCFDKEFSDIFEKLLPESQDFLFKVAKDLLSTQNRLVQKGRPEKDIPHSK